MTQLVEYLRSTPRKRKVGVLFAKPQGTNFAVGYSLCCDEDEFDRDFGLWLAEKRADKFSIRHPFTEPEEVHVSTESVPFKTDSGTWVSCNHHIPDSVMRQLPVFMARCQAYYKDLDTPYWYHLISA